jgi:hypothetical protein
MRIRDGLIARQGESFMQLRGWIAATALFVFESANALPQFSATVLDFRPVAINNSGQIVGVKNGSAVLWSHGVLIDLGPGAPIDINSSGTVLGSDWLWSSATGRISPGFSNAVALSNSGIVVSGVPNDGGSSIWRASTGAVPITIHGNSDVRVYDVNSRGTATVEWLGAWTDNNVGLWTSDTENGQLPRLFDCCEQFGRGLITDSGLVAAISLTPAAPIPGLSQEDFDNCESNGCSVATIWSPALDPMFVGYMGEEGGGIFALNERRHILGQFGSYLADQTLSSRSFFGSISSGLIDLTSLIVDPPTLDPSWAFTGRSINDRDWIVGGGTDGYYLLRPLPEPPTWLGLLCGIALLVRRRASES